MICIHKTLKLICEQHVHVHVHVLKVHIVKVHVRKTMEAETIAKQAKDL